MSIKVFKPHYKVHKSREKGLYYVSRPGKGQVYIRRTKQGSKSFYIVHGAPLFPTLRDAVIHIAYEV